MIRAYLDDSGRDPRSDYAIVAGHAGRREDWEDFVPRWLAAIGPSRTRLHMKSVRWRGNAPARMMERIGEVFRQTNLVPIVGGIRICDVSSLLPNEPVLVRLVNGYPMAIFCAVVGLLLATPGSEDVQVVLAKHPQDEIAYHVLTTIMNLPDSRLRKPDGSSKLSAFTFRPSSACGLLDQADCLAYSAFHRYSDPSSAMAAMCSPALARPSAGLVLCASEARDVTRQMLAHLGGVPPPADPGHFRKFISKTRVAMGRPPLTSVGR